MTDTPREREATQDSGLSTQDWLKTLPHQIPFRAASAVTKADAQSIEGVYLCTANDTLPAELMLVEAMAQFAGGLAFHEARGHGFFSGVDRCEITRAIEPGDAVAIRVVLEVAFGGTFRFSGTGHVDGVEVAKARFYLASPPAEA
jgi:3-hydroxymyristoyl/3-hydroxydecanoyl-(acyl carrier protein) dehydratase